MEEWVREGEERRGGRQLRWKEQDEAGVIDKTISQ
jgi:hypothetical protein